MHPFSTPWKDQGLVKGCIGNEQVMFVEANVNEFMSKVTDSWFQFQF